MTKFGRHIVKHRIAILILAVLLLVPSFLGMVNTRINYDILDYLPENMDTVKGQNILLEDFNKGGFSLILVKGMRPYDISLMKDKIAKVEHVETVLWYDDLADVTVPVDILPKKFYDAFNRDDETILAVFFDTSTSSDETIKAIGDIRGVCSENCFVTGMSALVTDLKNLCEKEEPVYVGLAVVFACLAMIIFMDSWLIPVVFLASIGMAILYNLGSNYFMGEISYITKALSAVLQLAVTMDYSIFLWHSYSEEKLKHNGDKNEAMANAIGETFTAVLGSSVTTIAGFMALCFMTFTMGRDLGIVMAKGVVLGVIACLTILPAMILALDKAIEKTRHRALLPNMDKIARLITKNQGAILVLFLIISVPAVYGYSKSEVYYDMSTVLPQEIDYVVANAKLQNDFDMASTHMVLASSDMSHKNAKKMLKEIEDLDGIRFAIGLDSALGASVPDEILPNGVKSTLKGDKYQLILIGSQYHVSSDSVNEQIVKINGILDKYDKGAMLIGEAPCTKDLIDVTDHDFMVVSAISIVAIFIIIAAVFKSISLPVILVAVIEFAIFINLGIPYYTKTSLPFIAPICISTIQLGATVDYAILMTTRYKKERSMGMEKREAITTALSVSIPSIMVSALGFFAATFGVAVYSDIDIIGSMCSLMARGAIVSMFSVMLVLPSMLMLCDKIICKTSLGFGKRA